MPAEDHTYVALFRAVFRASDDVEAIMIADQVKVNGERDLEQEDGDTLDVMQVTQNMAELTPEATVILLRRARNALIRTRSRDMVDCARELDKCAHIIKAKASSEIAMGLGNYDYGQFIEVMEEVLGGSNPVHI
jgi:hypothetical protein